MVQNACKNNYTSLSGNIKYTCIQHFTFLLVISVMKNLTFWHRNYFFLILAHTVYKM